MPSFVNDTNVNGGGPNGAWGNNFSPHPQNFHGMHQGEEIRQNATVSRFLDGEDLSLMPTHPCWYQKASMTPNQPDDGTMHMTSLPAANYYMQKGQLTVVALQEKVDARDVDFTRKLNSTASHFLYHHLTREDRIKSTGPYAKKPVVRRLGYYSNIAGVVTGATNRTSRARYAPVISYAVAGYTAIKCLWDANRLRNGSQIGFLTVRIPRVEAHKMTFLPNGMDGVCAPYTQGRGAATDNATDLDPYPFVVLPAIVNPDRAVKWDDEEWAERQKRMGVREPDRYLLHPEHLKRVKSAYAAKPVDSKVSWDSEPNCMFERLGFVVHLPRKQPNHVFVANAPFNEHALEALPVMQICMDSDTA